MRARIAGVAALALAVCLQTSANAQTLTTVTGTITDPNGVPYANARVAPLLLTNGSSSAHLTPCNTGTGCQIANPAPVTTDPTGSFLINLWANASILPAGSSYSFQVSILGVPPPLGSGPQTFTVTGITIAGASQSLSVALSAAAPILCAHCGGGGSSAFASLTPGTNTQAGTFAGSGNTWDFSSALAFKLPVTGITSQCLHVDSTGLVSGTGTDCGTGTGGANTALSNLGVTSINSDLLPGSGTLFLGSLSKPWGFLVFGPNPGINDATLNFTGTGLINMNVPWTASDDVVGAAATQTLTNKTLTSPVLNGSLSGTAMQGTDTKALSSGTVSGTSVLLCTDASGGATTVGCPAGGGGANTTLSNLVSPTAINQDLLPDTNGIRNLGSGTNWWSTATFGNGVAATTMTGSGDTANRNFSFPDASGVGLVSGTPVPTNSHCVKYNVFGGGTTQFDLTDAGFTCMQNPMTAIGDRIGGGAAGAATRIAGGLTGQVDTAANGATGGFQSPGVADGNGGAAVTTTPYPIACDSSTTLLDRLTTIRFQAGASVVTVPLSTATGCGNHFALTLIDDGAGTLTVNATSADTFTVVNGSTNTDGATSFTLASGQYASLNQGATGIWNVRITTGGGTGLSGMTAGQVPIAATASTVTSSKAIQGTDTNLLSSGTVAGTGATLCTDATGGATTTGCSGGGGSVNLCTNNPAPGAYTPTNVAGAVDCLTAGTYTLPTSVTTISSNNVTILGTTPGVIVKRGSGASGVKFTGNQDQIIGVTLDANAVTSTVNFIEMAGTDDTAQNIIVQNPGTVSSAFATFAFTGSASRPTVDNVSFLGTQVDGCVAVNPAGTGSGTIDHPKVTNINVAAFGPSAGEQCIWLNQVSGSAVTDAIWDSDSVNVSTTNGTAFSITGQAVVQSTVSERHHLSKLTATTTVVASRLIHIFACNWCSLTDFSIDDGGHGVSGPALDLGDLYNSTVKGMSIQVTGGLETGISCIDCAWNSFVGSTINGVGNGDFGISIGSSAASTSFNTITGNICTLAANATCYFLQANGAGDPVSYNNFYGNTSVGTNAANQLGLTLTDTTGGMVGNIIHNNIYRNLTGTGDVCITIGAGATNTQIGQQLFDAVTTRISDAGTSTTKSATDSGPVTGTLASGTATVTLPVTFTAVADAVCTASDTTTPGTAINAALASTTTATVKGTSTDAFVVRCGGW